MLINSNDQNSNRIGSEWSLCMVKAGTGFVTLFYITNIFDRSFAKILGRICVYARVWIDNGACMALVLWIPLELWTIWYMCRSFTILISYGICILLDIYFFLFLPWKPRVSENLLFIYADFHALYSLVYEFRVCYVFKCYFFSVRV